MLALALAWAVLGAAAVVIGTGVLSLADASPYAQIEDRALLAAWLGTLALGVALLAVSLIMPLASTTCVLVALVLVLGAAALPGARLQLVELLRGVKPWTAVGVAAVVLGVALFTSQQVSLYDTGLYHAGAIEWLSRFGSVRGVAFLEYRFGFASSWFALAAAFNTGPLAGHAAALTGGYAFLLGTVHFLVSAIRVGRGNGRVADWFATIAYLVALTWLVRSGLTISPSPDVPVIVLGIVVSWAALLLVTVPGRRDAGRRLPAHAMPVLLAVAAFTLKTTAAPLVVVAVVFYLWKCGFDRRLFALGGLAALIYLPNVLVSLTTSGCPLFPSPVLCTNAPWSLGGAAASADQGEGRDFLRWTGAPPAGANSFNWIPHWLRNEPLGTISIAYMLVSSAGAVVLARRARTEGAGWMVAMGLVGAAFVLALSPTYRFMLAYLVVPPAFLGALIATQWKLRPAALLPPILVAIVSLVLATSTDPNTMHLTPSARAYALILPVAGLAAALALWKPPRFSLPQVGLAPAAVLFAFLIASRNPSPLSNVALPPPLPAVEQSALIKEQVNDLSYFKPPDTKVCWDVIPCTTWAVRPSLHLVEPKRGLAGGLGA